MGVDGEVPQEGNAEIQGPKRKVIRDESEDAGLRSGIMELAPGGSRRNRLPCRALSAFHKDLCICATNVAVTKPSDTGRWLPLWWKTVERRSQ